MIYEEVTLFFHSCLIGIGITLLYDGFLICRKLIPHHHLWISVEDFFYWLFCAVGIFCVLVEENNGTLRWFVVAGAALGMIVYKKSVSPLYVNTMSAILGAIFHFLCKITRCCAKPVKRVANIVFFALKRGRYKGKKCKKCIKKKLTVFIKLLKITLCKQNKKHST